MDGNEAVASVAYRGALHGALTAGSLATTFTASQGLLLMLPNMYKLAGELTPVVIHVAARTVASHAPLLINSPHGQTTWAHLPGEVQREILDKALRVHVIDAYRIAVETGLGHHINTVMQVCFFALSRQLPLEQALPELKGAIERSYAKKGVEVVRRNLAAVDATIERLVEFDLPRGTVASSSHRGPVVPREAPEFVQRVTAALLAGRGDLLPVSAFPLDGTWSTGTTRWEKRGLALEIPSWDAQLCIQCNKCLLACPHAAIRAKVYPAPDSVPEGFKAIAWKGGELAGQHYTLQVAPDDCTGCRLCAEVCPAKDKSNPRHRALDMVPLAAQRDAERARLEHPAQER